jgi:hypothetical protein
VQQAQFDSFGERLPDDGVQTPAVQQRASRWMLFCVIGFFWLAIAAAVAARVIYVAPAS